MEDNTGAAHWWVKMMDFRGVPPLQMPEGDMLVDRENGESVPQHVTEMQEAALQ